VRFSRSVVNSIADDALGPDGPDAEPQFAHSGIATSGLSAEAENQSPKCQQRCCG
jgi:hypothetical protein